MHCLSDTLRVPVCFLEVLAQETLVIRKGGGLFEKLEPQRLALRVTHAHTSFLIAVLPYVQSRTILVAG
jgi:hypothetical protein